VLFVGGVILLIFLVVWTGAGAVASVLSRMAWWQLVLICLPYGLIMAVDTLGWRYAFANGAAPYGRMLLARIAGEALNLVTALGSVGGEAVKAWLLRSAASYEASVLSLIIAKTTSTIAQTLLLVVGLIVVWIFLPESTIISAMLALLAVEALLVGGFLAAQLAGLVRRAGGVLVWAGLIENSLHAERLDESLRGFYRHRWDRFLLSVVFHLCGWLLGVLEVAAMLFVLGIPAEVATSTVIEAVGSGVRFATFLVPGSLGVLEGANTGLFVALGLGASAGLAFSLVRRARQLVWISIGLLVLAGSSLQLKTGDAGPQRAARSPGEARPARRHRARRRLRPRPDGP
jgi:glycosyltransferase 2 family protein